MGYIGNEPTTGHFPVDNFTSSGGSTYTLAKAPASAGAIEVSVQGVLQPTTAYTVSGATLTMPGVTTGVKIFVRHLGETLSLPTPADGSVTATKLGVNAITEDKLYISNAGSNGEFLSKQSGAVGGLTWAEASGGKVLKVTSHIHQAQATVSTTTMTTVTSKAITLVESNSKLLIIWTMWVGVGSDTAASLRILRDTTDLTSTFGGNTGTGAIPNTMGPVSAWAGHAGATYQPQNLSGTILDTPGGNVTYNFQIARTAGSNSTYLNTGSFSTNNGYHSKPASHAMFIEIAV
tara:strand:- start:404 stop:1276 length:873 start_codon:yes stop_codon:yes gene_type:complete